MKIKPLFAWYDLWIGAYWDRYARRLYVLPLPMVGFVIYFGDVCDNCGEPLNRTDVGTCGKCIVNKVFGQPKEQS